MKSLAVYDMVHHTPGEAPCTSAFTEPAHLARLGYTGQILVVPVQGAVTWDQFDPRIFPAGSAARRWVEAKAMELETQFRRVKAAGLLCLAKSDFIVLPRELVRLHLADLAQHKAKSFEHDVKGEFAPSIHDPRVQNLVRHLIDAIFERFPELDGIVARVGETYLHDLPYHTGGDPIVNGVASHVAMINLMRETICVKHGRRLMYRGWLSGIDVDADMYEAVSNQVEPHPNLWFSLKHCVNDFHRTHKFSPPLGRGRHPQLVEIQCAREYEGKGAYPNYIAGGVIDGFEEDANLMPAGVPRSLRELVGTSSLAGLWTWARGGGWRGPYIRNEFWCALNAYVLAKWAQDPSRQDSELIRAFAAENGFNDRDQQRIETICRKSAAAVVRGLASVKGGVDTWWTRDEFLGGVEDPASSMAKAVATVKKAGRVEEILAEREEAVRLWREMETVAGEIATGAEATRSFIHTSCAYGRILYEIIAAGWTVMFLEDASARIRAALRRYDAAWAEYRQLAATRNDCPTLYRDTYCRYVRDKGMIEQPGMGASVARIRRQVEG
ncbi:MAG: hypothetical protein PCFJNLEI_00623 [Verrucomicrobiae bacterium]|nr:hypothetical protein [Verrucomicrobiae bacterium]